MKRAAFLLLCPLLLAAGPSVPLTPLRITVEVVGGASGGTPVSGVLRLVPQVADPSRQESPETLEFPFEAPGQRSVPVPADKAWQVELQAAGYWSEPQAVPAGKRVDDVRVRIFPLSRIRAKLVRPDAGALPGSVTVGVKSTANQFGSGDSLDAMIACPVRDEALDCAVPAGRVDLRLRAEGFTPLYLWDLTLLPREIKDFGTLRLARGASVVGWVQEEDGKPSSGARAELVPEDFGDVQNVVVNRELQRMKLESRSNDKGFFQIADVPPGRYVLTVSKEGFAPVRVQPVAVRPDLEAQMIDKLVLARPVIFEVVVDPPVEPYGKPWEIELLRRSSPAGRHMDRIAGKVSQEGTWKSPGIPPGTYELGILGDLGTRWHSESVEIEPGEPVLHVEIPVLAIRGTVTLGDEPFPATVWLGREGRSLRFDSDTKGRFDGLLPEEGTWNVDIASQEENWRMSLDPVEIQVPRGKRFAEVAIEVPDTRLMGEVVDSSGRPVPGASVEASAGPKRSSRRKTDEKGEFEIRGLPPGPVVASAQSEGIESEAALVQLAEGVESPRLRLVLQRSRTVEGRVVSPTGGLPGARVFAWPASGSPGASISEDITRSDGSFRLEVRGEAALLNVLILPPGYAFRMTTVLAEPGHKPEISVEANGGTLVFELSEGRGAPPILVHNGVFVPIPLLDVWRRLQGDRPSDPRRIVVPQMEAGLYSLCVGAGAIASLRQGGEPPAASCSTGVLSPFGELLLRSPGTQSPAP